MSHRQTKVRNKSYVPKTPEFSYVVPLDERVFPIPPVPSELQRKKTELRRERCVAPFEPEKKVGSINLEDAWRTARDLFKLGFIMIKGAAEFSGDVTVEQLVASELTHGTAGQESLDTALDDGAFIGPIAMRFPGELVVFQGVGLWMRANQGPDNNTVA